MCYIQSQRCKIQIARGPFRICDTYLYPDPIHISFLWRPFTGTIICSLNWKNEKSCPDLGNCSRLGFDWSNSQTLWWTPMYWRITLLQNMGKVFVSSYILLTLFFFKEKPLFSFLEETNVYLHGLLKETVTLKKLWIMIYSKLQYKVIIGGWNDSARSKCKNVIKIMLKKCF